MTGDGQKSGVRGALGRGDHEFTTGCMRLHQAGKVTDGRIAGRLDDLGELVVDLAAGLAARDAEPAGVAG